MFCTFSASQPSIDQLDISSTLTKQQIRGAKSRIYDFSRVKKNKKWLKNVLTEKSDTDSSDSDSKNEDRSDINHTSELIRDMKRLYDMQIKVKRVNREGLDRGQFRNLTSSFLDEKLPCIVPSNATNNNNNNNSTTISPTKGRKTNKSVFRGNRKRTNTESSFSPVVSTSGTNPSTSPIIPPLSEVSQSPSLTSVSSSQCAPNIDPFVSETYLSDSKRTKLDTLLDEIPYDATLPDEILQSESSAIDSEPAPSYTPSMSDDINLPSLIHDDIYDTDASCTSLLSQCLSQPAKSLTNGPPITQLKCLTAPTTPAASPPSTPSSLVINSSLKGVRKNSKKTKETSPEKLIPIKRKKLWISIARKDVIRAQKVRSLNHKEILANCKKKATWCLKEVQKEDDDQFSEQQNSDTVKIVNRCKFFKKIIEKRMKKKNRDTNDPTPIPTLTTVTPTNSNNNSNIDLCR